MDRSTPGEILGRTVSIGVQDVASVLHRFEHVANNIPRFSFNKVVPGPD